MQFEKQLKAELTNIPGLVVFELPVHGDNRSKPPLKQSTNRVSEKTYNSCQRFRKWMSMAKIWGLNE